MKLQDTIAAIATPIGAGGIAILRISGADASEIAGRSLSALHGGPLCAWESHKLTLCRVHRADRPEQVMDQALAVIMRAPHSYTGEDVVEIHCHGGVLAANRILKEILDAGARMAEPGEFTRRAFLNGKTSLNEAEAVMDMIDAQSDLGLENAARSLEGTLSEKIDGLREMVMGVTAHISATADYPEEVDAPEETEMQRQFEELLQKMQALLDTFETGRMLRDGVMTVIAGRPNVGKSSLLNALSRSDRAIVTDIPGTTRDVIEEYIRIGGRALRLMDTAGLRQGADTVEQIGIDRARAHMQEADLCLFVVDGSQPLSQEDLEIRKELSGKRTLVLLNKADQGCAVTRAMAAEQLEIPLASVLHTALPKNGKVLGVVDLEKRIGELLLTQTAQPGQVYLSNARQRDSLRKAMDAVERAKEANRVGMPYDLLYVDLEDALSSLGEITGVTVQEEIIDQVFQRFCVGK